MAQALIGHDSEDVHQLYISLGREALQKAVAKLPKLSKRATRSAAKGKISFDRVSDVVRSFQRIRDLLQHL